MAHRSVGLWSAIAVMGMLAGGCATDSSMRASGGGSSSGGVMTTSSMNNINRVASGAVEDTQNACMARIPTGASADQRMLAEESCRRDQENRR